VTIVSLLLAALFIRSSQPTEAGRVVLLVVDQGHLERERVPEMLSAVESILGAANPADTKAAIVSGRQIVYPDATSEALSGSLAGAEGFYDLTRRLGMTEAEAREIVRGNESVRDSVRKRGGGDDVHVRARQLTEDVQALGEATLDSLSSLVAKSPARATVVFVSDRPILFRSPDKKAMAPLREQLERAEKRLLLVQISPPRISRVSEPLVDALPLLSALPNAARVDLSVPGAGPSLGQALRPAAPPSAGPPADDALSRAFLVDRTTAHVARFAKEASFLIARESYTQEVKSRAGSFNLPASATAGITIEKRQLESEVALVQLLEQQVWLLARDIVQVDGKAVPDADRRRIPATASAGSQEAALRDFQRIAEAGSRFDIGPIKRDLSVPTLALWFLTPAMKDRFEFDAAGNEAVEGVRCTVVRFIELGKGMLTIDGNPVPARGRYWIAPDSGAVVKTELVLARVWSTGRFSGTPTQDASGGRAQIVVTYRFEPAVDSWVPAEMRELYVGAAGRTADWVVGTAKYTGYRRFGVESRIR
jgi:hypothetical protein